MLEAALKSAKRRPGRQNARIYHELGLVQFSLGRPREAMEYFEQALQIIESDEYQRRDREYITSINMDIARTLYELGEYHAAGEVYRKLLRAWGENEPTYWICRWSLAGCETASNRFEDARKNLEAIVNSESPVTIRDSAGADLLSLRYRIAFRDYEDRDYQSSITQLESLLKESIGDDSLRSDILASSQDVSRKLEPAMKS